MLDALGVARNLALEPYLVYGGGAVEMAVSQILQEKGKSVSGVKQWPYTALAQALEVMIFIIVLFPFRTVCFFKEREKERTFVCVITICVCTNCSSCSCIIISCFFSIFSSVVREFVDKRYM